MRKLLSLFLVLLVLPFASGAVVDLSGGFRASDGVYVFGLELGSDYFVVSVSDGGFVVGFSRDVPVKRVVSMSYLDLSEFFWDYFHSKDMERVGLLSTTFSIPVGYLLDMDGLGVVDG